MKKREIIIDKYIYIKHVTIIYIDIKKIKN